MQKRSFIPIKHQSGQGMVEYAILLILTITLVIGGIELASTALASGKASDAAKAGASELAAVNEKRLKAQENQQKYLRQIDILTNGQVFIQPIGLNENDEEFPEFQYFLTQTEVASLVVTDAIFDNFVKFLDYFRDKALRDLGAATITQVDIVEGYLDFFNTEDPEVKSLYIAQHIYVDAVTPLPTTSYSVELDEIIQQIDGILDDDENGVAGESDADGNITAEEIIHAIDHVTDIDTDGDGVKDGQFNLLVAVQNLNPTSINDKVTRYKALILIEEIQLAGLPLDPNVDLSEAPPLIGDHVPDFGDTNSEFTRPFCQDGDNAGEVVYRSGLPGTLDDDGIAKTTVDLEGDAITVPAVYLFNPLPINVTSCQGNDANRGGRSQLSILVGGYEDNANPENNVAGLPKLNQAFFGQYNRVYLKTVAEDGKVIDQYTSPSDANSQELLVPPGKLCLSDVATVGIDSCPGLDETHIGTSGYYFWGYGNAANPKINENDRYKWIYNEIDPPEFRPTMQIICNNQVNADDGRTLIQDAEACDAESEVLRTVRINVRFRSVFESFLTFGLMELTDPNNIGGLADYFYDPSNMRALGNGSVGVPIAGSELGPKSARKNPTVKNFKDFRGCYEINLETNQVTSCN